MNTTNNPKLTRNSQELRRNMTRHEKRLWYDFLKGLSVNFNRQKVIGCYIADFYCASARVIIELDGSQHYEPLGIQNDKARDEYFKNLGLTVLRYSNYDIDNNFRGVCEDVLRRITTSSTASGPPSPQGEGINRLLLEEKLSPKVTDEV